MKVKELLTRLKNVDLELQIIVDIGTRYFHISDLDIKSECVELILFDNDEEE